MNKAVFDFFGVNSVWNTITDILLVLVISTFLSLGIMGMTQWAKRKNLFKVDKELLCMIPSLILLVVIYAVFENIWIINYRPILINGVAEPSFPSIHTMVSVSLGSMMMIALPKYIKDKTKRTIANIAISAVIILISFGRILAGMHWLSDVCGGIVFGVILVAIYAVILKIAKEKDEQRIRKDSGR